jgi:hypothetical protein
MKAHRIQALKHPLSVLVCLLAAAPLFAQHWDKQLDYTTSWIGNSFRGGDKWVQHDMDEFQVEPDGTCYATTSWDEAGRQRGVYKDGEVIGNNAPDINPGQVTVKGSRWYIEGYQDGDASPFDKGAGIRWGSKIVKESGSVAITDITVARGLGVGHKSGLLMVADDSPGRHYIRCYNPDNGQFVKSYGDSGGVFAGPEPGKVTDTRWWMVRGCGEDSEGNIYVCIDEEEFQHSGAFIKCFLPDGKTLKWEVHAYFHTDCADFEPGTEGRSIYGMTEHIIMDYTKPNGRQYTLVGNTLDYYKYPEDARWTSSFGFGASVSAAKIGGKVFLFMSSQQYGARTFRLDGEIAVYLGDVPGSIKEYAFQITDDGTVWNSPRPGPIREIQNDGLNADGTIKWKPEVTYPRPAPFSGDVNGIFYLGGEQDIMVLGGFTPENPCNGGWEMGHEIVRYDNWHTTRDMKWRTVIIYEHNEKEVPFRRVPLGLEAAGDYVFVDYGNYNADDYQVDAPGPINVYKLSDGSFVGEIFAGEEVANQSSWHDFRKSFHAMMRSNGEYLILAEENWKSKQLLYRWCPSGNCPEPAETGTVGPKFQSNPAQKKTAIHRDIDGRNVRIVVSAQGRAVWSFGKAGTSRTGAFIVGYADGTIGKFVSLTR